jgi:hypothetical protein
MIWFKKSDRQVAAFAEAIRPELVGLRVPRPSTELRERILADRAAGARVILPVEREAGVSSIRYLIAAVAVIVALLALPSYRANRDETSAAQPVVLLSLFGGVAHAEQPRGVPRLPAALAVHPERVHAGTLRYRRVFNDSGEHVAKTGESVLSLAADNSTGTPAWRVTRVDRDLSMVGGTGAPPVTSAETLLVRQKDLGLMTRVVHVRPYRRWNGINIQQRITTDSVNGRMTLEDVKGMRPIARRLPAPYAPFLSDALTPVYLAAVPLGAQWQGSVTVLGWAVIPKDVLHPVELRVTGEERVRVPAGTFDCWRMTIRHSGGVIDYWVRKSDGIAVRLVEQTPAGGQRIMALAGESGM